MSTDQYPEVHDDESGIVPPQSTRISEWPKKLRTLTAAELDRLTIDEAGRFYWDGQLVNYGTEPKQPAENNSDSLERSMDIIDRATYELTRKSVTTIEGELAPIDAPGHGDSQGALDLGITRDDAALAPAPAAEAIRADHTRLKLSTWQTAGAMVMVLAIMIGAFGMATYGYVAAREWGCKTGSIQSGCPVVPVVKPPERPDIPA